MTTLTQLAPIPQALLTDTANRLEIGLDIQIKFSYS